PPPRRSPDLVDELTDRNPTRVSYQESGSILGDRQQNVCCDQDHQNTEQAVKLTLDEIIVHNIADEEGTGDAEQTGECDEQDDQGEELSFFRYELPQPLECTAHIARALIFFPFSPADILFSE